jgi:hypothetical protein
MKEQLFGDSCQQILDFFRLSEKISTFAKNIFFNNFVSYDRRYERKCKFRLYPVCVMGAGRVVP